MDRKTVIATGATALAAAAVLLGAAPASAAEPAAQAKAFSIEAVALPGAHSTPILTPNLACCSILGCY